MTIKISLGRTEKESWQTDIPTATIRSAYWNSLRKKEVGKDGATKTGVLSMILYRVYLGNL